MLAWVCVCAIKVQLSDILRARSFRPTETNLWMLRANFSLWKIFSATMFGARPGRQHCFVVVLLVATLTGFVT